LGGVVCSAREARAVREACGEGFVIVTPGIRPSGSIVGDQKRVVSPKEALEAGSDYLVIGRPVLESPNPVQALDSILADLSGA
jgi:orotidine-5'-phosphate decarboxylase